MCSNTLPPPSKPTYSYSSCWLQYNRLVWHIVCHWNLLFLVLLNTHSHYLYNVLYNGKLEDPEQKLLNVNTAPQKSVNEFRLCSAFIQSAHTHSYGSKLPCRAQA